MEHVALFSIGWYPPGGRKEPSWSSASSTASACPRRSARPTGRMRSTGGSWTRSSYVKAADAAGFKYAWVTEHHFLEEYSHLSASESFIAYAAAQTSNIHLGSGIFNITPPVNHPARIAERVAMLDHLSEGRFEFGTGRGSSTTEQRGFGIEDPELTREMVAETLPEIVRMWRDEDYSFDGKFLLDARTKRPAEAVHEAAPTALGGSRQPLDLRARSSSGTRGALLRVRQARAVRTAHREVQEGHRERRSGRWLREQQHHGHDPDALPRRRAAGRARSSTTSTSATT